MPYMLFSRVKHALFWVLSKHLGSHFIAGKRYRVMPKNQIPEQENKENVLVAGSEPHTDI